MIDLNRDFVKNPATTFYGDVENDSMEPVIHDGSMVIYDSSLEIRNGNIIVAILDGEWCVKYYREYQGGVYLVSENEKYAPIKITEEMNLIKRGRVTTVIYQF